MSEATFDEPSPEDPACPECGRIPKHWTAGKCDACYKRERRRAGTRKWPRPDPEITAGLFEVPGTSLTFPLRVFAHVDATGDCWEWRGARNYGYGVIKRGGNGAGNEQAHRAVWLLLVGEIPDGYEIDHLCRNHACVNPDHLEPVPPEENKRRGYSPPALCARRTVCDNGHLFDGRRKRGERYCKTCVLDQQRRRYHENKRRVA